VGEQITYSVSEAEQETTAGTRLKYLPQEAFGSVRESTGTAIQKAALFAQMARFNTLYMVAKAGSGHLGSSFSSIDIMSWLYLNVLGPGDRFFSSKGHDSPGLYSVQAAIGILPFDKIHGLRRLDGLPGHPDVGTPGAYTNTGSLGMGVSKAKGFVFSDLLHGKTETRVYVLTGDGELQEGQFWESLMSATRDARNRLTVIVDHNKVQSDSFVSVVSDLGDLEAKFAAFDCDVFRCDGHDLRTLGQLLERSAHASRTQVIVADTRKGRGVAFMEHTSMPPGEEYYRFHSGAPSPEDYSRAAKELLDDIHAKALELGIGAFMPIEVEVEPLRVPGDAERMIPAYSEVILDEAAKNGALVALDADLILDTGLIPFRKTYPQRFIECGIAEQDMVSRAGTMALGGLLPVVHSFACFLTTRAAEQIYNNCTERSKIIYMGALAGVLPGGPGHSHQAVRDITAMSSMPGITMIEPASAAQLQAAVRWAVRSNAASTYLRVTSIPYEASKSQKALDQLQEGCGHVLQTGASATVVAAGPIMTYQALGAAAILSEERIDLKVISMPWLNKFNMAWFQSELEGGQPLMTLENHYVESGFGVMLAAQLAQAGLLGNRKLAIEGIKEIPACGRNDEVLAYHELTADKIATKLRCLINNATTTSLSDRSNG
jgi:transketolase